MSQNTNDNDNNNDHIDSRLEADIALLNSLTEGGGAATTTDFISMSADDDPDEFDPDDDVSMSRKVYSSRRYHIPDEEDNPECRYGNKDIDYRLRDREVAREWYEPCSFCFPDGDPEPASDAKEEDTE